MPRPARPARVFSPPAAPLPLILHRETAPAKGLCVRRPCSALGCAALPATPPARVPTRLPLLCPQLNRAGGAARAGRRHGAHCLCRPRQRHGQEPLAAGPHRRALRARHQLGQPVAQEERGEEAGGRRAQYWGGGSWGSGAGRGWVGLCGGGAARGGVGGGGVCGCRGAWVPGCVPAGGGWHGEGWGKEGRDEGLFASRGRAHSSAPDLWSGSPCLW